MVIFLDLDGVVNRETDWGHPYTVRTECVKSLAVLIKALKADVVLTSSWIMGWVREGKCTPKIENLKHVFRLHGITINGRTANSGNRSQEIADYCRRHGASRYLILDDDLSLFTTAEKLYKVNAKTGLTNHDVKVILKKCKKCCSKDINVQTGSFRY